MSYYLSLLYTWISLSSSNIVVPCMLLFIGDNSIPGIN